MRLAEQISTEAVKKNLTVDILIEVNVAGEESKFGTTCQESIDLVEASAKASRHLCKGADDDCSVCGRPRGEPDLL